MGGRPEWPGAVTQMPGAGEPRSCRPAFACSPGFTGVQSSPCAPSPSFKKNEGNVSSWNKGKCPKYILFLHKAGLAAFGQNQPRPPPSSSPEWPYRTEGLV